MSTLRIQTFFEDHAQQQFIRVCQEIIVSRLNESCKLEKHLELEEICCDGISNIFCNTLQSLILRSKRLLLALDLDANRCDQSLFHYVEQQLNKLETKEGWKFKVTLCRENVIKGKINNHDHIVVILPLGLASELPATIKRHSVEDYILKELLNGGMTSKHSFEKSKDMLNDIVDKKLNDEKIDYYLRRSILSHKDQIIHYLEPLWSEK